MRRSNALMSLMSPMSLMSFMVFVIAVCTSTAPALAVPTSWNAYNDFYLSPTAAGWGGATSPSAAGAAWGYYAANVNGFGFPTQIGAYFTPTASGSGSQNLYQYSDVAPIGAGTPVGASAWAPTGGAGFAYYGDTSSWGSSLGSYPTPWFDGAPGISQSLTNLMWFQSGWLSGTSSEGIAPVLTWKAPASGDYTFTGLFVSGDQPSNSAAVAIVDSLLGTAPLARTVLANNSTQSFSFTNSYGAGDVVQFQVGNNFSTGNAVGLQVTIVPEPSALALAGLGVAAAAVCGVRRRRSH
jgi:hypothetical protein